MVNYMNFEYIDDWLLVDATIGDVRWRKTKGRRKALNSVGSTIMSTVGYPYIVFSLMGKKVMLHRFLYEYVHGPIPDGMRVDHIDGNTMNNGAANLRICTVAQNAMNCKLHAHNTSGYKGVSFDKRTKRWVASIHYNNKTRFLGRFDTKEQAFHVATNARRDIFGEFFSERNTTPVVDILPSRVHNLISDDERV